LGQLRRNLEDHRPKLDERILVAGGTPKQIVDKLEQWHFETGANGGFMLARGFSAPGNLQEFVDHVVPELQRLRDNLLA
jgi:alkanesulfonate monooxygenase SsuD/methylene tetrahydromethanopterin reductase-like flavin-dependent oxidoreductase (luciferase family)